MSHSPERGSSPEEVGRVAEGLRKAMQPGGEKMVGDAALFEAAREELKRLKLMPVNTSVNVLDEDGDPTETTAVRVPGGLLYVTRSAEEATGSEPEAGILGNWIGAAGGTRVAVSVHTSHTFVPWPDGTI